MPRNNTTNIKKGDDYRHGDLVNACIEVGLKIIKNKGVEKLSLRGISREIGVSIGAPYKHFATKEALLAAIAQRGFELFESYMRLPVSDGIHLITRESFVAMAYQYLRFANENPEYYRLMFTNVILNHRQYPDLWKASRRTFYMLIEGIEVLQRMEIIRPGRALDFATHTWAVLHGFASLHVENRLSQLEAEPRPLEERFRPHVELLWAGLEIDHNPAELEY